MKAKFILTAIIALSITSITASAQYKNMSLQDENYRINQGVRNGELTRYEAANLRHKEANIRREAICYKANDGRIGPRERADLRRDQRKLDRQIFIQKHDRQKRF